MNKLILIVLLSCSMVGFSQTKKISGKLSEQQIAKHFAWVMQEICNPNSKNILVVAHRGDWRNAPENSIQALKNCINMGVDIMEMDLKMTKDSVLVLMHDNTIDRTMSGKGEPKLFTLDSLKKMTLKSSIACPSRHRIPTFEEFMLAAKDKMFINIDKGYPYLKEVKRVLEKTGTIKQVMINTEKNYQSNITDYGTLFTQLPMKANANLDNKSVAEVYEYIEKMKPRVMEINFSTDTSRFVQNHRLIAYHRIKIYVNSLWPKQNAGHDDDIAVEENKPDETWGWLIEHGANIIQTDRPKELLLYLKKKGMHQE